jgi:Divergent InlB B-repeat domain
VRRIVQFALLLSLVTPAFGQLYTNLDDLVSCWQNPPCIGSACAGGVGYPTAWNQTFGNASPSIDGASMFLTESGSNYYNVMWPCSVGSNDSDTYLYGSYWIYLPSATFSNFQSVGSDMYLFDGPTRYMFGTECDLAGAGYPYWHVWDQRTSAWISTGHACTLTSNTWAFIQFQGHRVPGDTSCLGSTPALYYDFINVNGASIGSLPSECTGPNSHSDDRGMQYDLNGNSGTGTVSAYIDQMTFYPSVGPTTTNYDNQYCPIANGEPTWGASDGPATLPLVCYNTALTNTPATGSVVNVSTAAQLTTALAAAVCGQQITLQAGNSFSGHFTIPALNCPANNYLWIQSSAMSSLPAEAARYSATYTNSQGTQILTAPQFGPAYAGVTSLPGRPPLNLPATPGTYTAQLITPDTSPVLNFTAGTSGVRIMGLEITRASGTGFVAQLINLGNIGNISYLVFDRDWMHGNTQTDETETAFNTSGTSYVASVDSYYSDFYCVTHCTDSHAIFGGVNTVNSNPEVGHKYVNNYIEASGENLFYGGGPSNTTPSDIEIRGNLNLKPMTWRVADPAYNGGVGGNPYIVKNLLEFKNAQRVFGEGNMFVNNWSGFSQGGPGWDITPVNQSGGAPNAFDANITMRYNWSTSVNFAVEMDMANNSGYLAAGENHYSIHDNVWDNLGYCQPTCPTSSTTVQMTTSRQIANASQTQHDVTVNHNSFIYNPVATPSAAIGLSNPTIASGKNQYNENYINNLQQTFGGTLNQEGGSDPTNCANGITVGAPMFAACWTAYTVTNNCFIANGSHTWPGTNITSVASYAAALTSYNNGFGGNYVVATSSPCKSAGTDGLDDGANIPLVLSTIGGLSLPQTLTVTVTGSGSVTDNFSEISCPSTCTASYTANTVVTLTATPSGGYAFTGWSGACGGVGSCSVLMSGAQAVTATFSAITPPLNGITIQNGVTITQGVLIQ